MERQRSSRKGKGMMSVLMMAGWGILVHILEEEKGKKAGLGKEKEE
jgi:hypothetical protein